MILSSILSLKRSLLYLLLLSASACTFDCYAMDPDATDEVVTNAQGRASATPRQTLHIISPEMVQIQQQLDQHLQRHPTIAPEQLHLQTKEDFENAMACLNLMEKMADIYQGAILASQYNPIAVDFSIQFDQKLISYISKLRSEACSSFRSEQDGESLMKAFYENYARFGRASITKFLITSDRFTKFAFLAHEEFSPTGTVTRLDLTMPTTGRHIFQIRSILSQSPDPHYVSDFQKLMESSTVSSLTRQDLEDPFLKADTALRNKIIGLRKEAEKNIREYLAKIDEDKEAYPFYFCNKTLKLGYEFIDILNEAPPNAYELIRKNMQSYFELEQEGLRFKAKVERKDPDEAIDLNLENLTQFYGLMTGMLGHNQKKDPAKILPHIIVSLVTADYKDEALIRLKVLQGLLLRKGWLSNNFIHFRAKIKAMCSDFDEINRLYPPNTRVILAPIPGFPASDEAQAVSEAKPKLKKKRRRKPRKTAKFRHRQAPKAGQRNIPKNQPIENTASAFTHAEQNSASLHSMPDQEKRKIKLQDMQPDMRVTPSAALVLPLPEQYHTSSGKEDTASSQEINEAESASAVSKASASHLPLPTQSLQLIFNFTPKSFKILEKVFSDDWTITRDDIEIFFRELGQEVNRKTKSSHHVVRIAQGIAIIRDDETLGIVSNLSENMEGHISLPKWEKTVPLYTRKDIVRLIDLMGITQHNYKKGQGMKFEARR